MKILIFPVLIIFLVTAGLLYAGIGLGRTLMISFNIATFAVWGLDKLQALRRGYRVPEIVLLGLVAIGGTPGAIAGQLVFQHKIRKSRFLMVFYTIAFFQVIVLTLISIHG